MCDAAIRPSRQLNELEVRCNKPDNIHPKHEGILSGTTTVVNWLDKSPFTFHGEWPGQCTASPACRLPNGHHGECAVD